MGLDALDAARAAATAGPWHVVKDEDVTEVWSPITEVAAYSNPADAALIVAAVNALPDLIAAARERDALRDAVLGLAKEWARESLDAVDRARAMPRTDENVRHHAAERRHGRVAAHHAAELRAVIRATLGEGT